MTFGELLNIITACEEITAVFGKDKDEITACSEVFSMYLMDAAIDAEVLEIATINGKMKVWCGFDDENAGGD